jgi:hypothetical protein
MLALKEKVRSTLLGISNIRDRAYYTISTYTKLIVYFIIRLIGRLIGRMPFAPTQTKSPFGD